MEIEEKKLYKKKYKKKRIIFISVFSALILTTVSIITAFCVRNYLEWSNKILFSVNVSSYIVDLNTDEKTLVQEFDTTRNNVDFGSPIITPEIDVDLLEENYFLFIYTLSNKTSDDYIFTITENITEKENVVVTYKMTDMQEEQTFSGSIDSEINAKRQIQISIFVYIDDLNSSSIFKGEFSLSFASLSGGES